MKYLSVCSGVEAATQAWEPLGWEPVAFSEIEPFPCAVLASRFPSVPNLGDMSRIHYNRETKELYNDTTRLVCDGGIDLLVGGTPCQSFSVAGKRAGLEGASGLAYHYARLLGEIRPRWFVWENVPGALSSVTYGDQRDFNFLLQQFAVGGDAALGCRWDLCWRVLDTQYVRVERFPRAIPQRRRRVFVVGRLAADGGGGCEVLLEPEGVRGDPAPRRVKGQGADGGAAPRAGGADGAVDAINCAMRGNRSADERGKLIESDFTRCAYTVTGVQTDSMAAIAIDRRNQCGLEECQDSIKSTVSDGGSTVCVRTANTGANGCGIAEGATHTLDGANGQAVAISFKGGQSADGGLGVDEGACQTMQSRMSAIEPTVAVSFIPGNSAKTRSLGEHREVAPTLSSMNGESGNRPSVAVGVKFGELLRLNGRHCDEVQPTLTRSDGKAGDNTPSVAIGIGRDAFNSGANAQMAQSISREVQPPLTAKGPGGGLRQCVPAVGTLCADDYKGVNNQFVSDGKVICERIR